MWGFGPPNPNPVGIVSHMEVDRLIEEGFILYYTLYSLFLIHNITSIIIVHVSAQRTPVVKAALR